jgi:hypothetical protein
MVAILPKVGELSKNKERARRPALRLPIRRVLLRRAPFFDTAFRLTAASQLESGDPTAPERDYLWLLPSRPDQFRRLSPRRTQSSTPLNRRSPTMPDLEREFNPAGAVCGLQGTASSPSSTTYLILPDWAGSVNPRLRKHSDSGRPHIYASGPIDRARRVWYSEGTRNQAPTLRKGGNMSKILFTIGSYSGLPFCRRGALACG